MGTIWFCLVAFMLAGYVVLDGFDIGAGILHLWVARTEAERRTVLRSIGSVWDGNEVWLIAGGGTLYFAFPTLYAASFSGFYLPLMMVLWLLILRGISIEFRSHVGGRVWSAFWDSTFALASILLAVFFGAALGNVVRGVPLDAGGYFFEPLWTNFLPVGNTGILDWYTILIGFTALAVLAVHGATWIGYKTEGALNERALRCASLLWWLVAMLTIVVTITTFRLLPQHTDSFWLRPWGLTFPILAVGGLLGVKWFVRVRQEAKAFAASCAYILGMLTSVAFSLYPDVLPASTNPFFGLTIENSKAADYGLKIGLVWWVIGMMLAMAYTVYSYRNVSGKVSVSEGERNEHY
ncbi:MAG TPA: cytochrome d ubiquinol oxidase subunit II [Candidatus Sulfotelmatobacter sp.]|nr:cytochrome d ubiquinol oxidase subunit II [Candidatus Sulfotelmatobacter sp.]